MAPPPDDRDRRGPPRPASDPATQLFDDFIEAVERGEAVDRAALLARAGPAAEHLAARIEAYERVQRLAERYGADAPLEAEPERIGRFRIQRCIGEGGLGRVYLAEDPTLGRRVALKVLDPLVCAGRSERALVLNEARSLARLEHPGIVRVFEVDAGEGNGPDSIAMEYVEGPTLAAVIAELRRRAGLVDADGPRSAAADAAGAPLRARIAAELEAHAARATCMLRIAEALAYCHDRGVVHRDIKPANVLFDGAGAPRLVDFGLAHLADRGEDARIDVTARLVGTPAYIAPEQVESGRTGADPRSDVFSFGTLAYELLSLVAPFSRPTRHLTLESVRRAAPRNLARRAPAAPPDLRRIVHRCLERDPRDRYPSAAELAADLRAFGAGRPLPYAGSSGARMLRLWLRRHRRALFASGLGLALVLGALLFAALSVAHARASRQYAAVEELRGRLAQLDTPSEGAPAAAGAQELRDTGGRLLELFAGARELSDSLLQRLTFGAPTRALEELRERWSDLVVRHLTADAARSERAGVPFQWVTWKELVALDARLGPGAASREFGTRGSLELEPSLSALGEVAFYAQVPFGGGLERGFPVYRRVEPLTHPVPGSYRVIVWGDDGRPAFEREVVQLSGWDAPLRIPLRERDPATLARARPFARGGREPQPGAAPIPVPAVLLTDPVSATEFRAFAAAQAYPIPRQLDRDLAEGWPAFVAWEDAAAYCAWVGGRLPTALELAHALAQGLELDLAPVALHAEWVLDLDPFAGVSQALAFKYQNLRNFPDAAPLTWSVTTGRQTPLAELGAGASPGTTFRVAFTDETREAFEALPAAHPR